MSKKNDNTPLETKTKWLDDHKLQDLADNPNNIVYKYEDTGEVRENQLTSDEAQEMVKVVRIRYLELRKSNPTWPDDKCRERICVEKKEWRNFAKSYSLIFKAITEHTMGEEELKHIFYMLYMYKLKETGALNEKDCNARVQGYMLKAFKTDRKPK